MDKPARISSMRNLVCPWSERFSVPQERRSDLEAYLRERATDPQDPDRDRHAARLASTFGRDGGLFCEPEVCAPVGGQCPLLCHQNVDPEIPPAVPGGQNKASLYWNDTARSLHDNPATADFSGEYIDSFSHDVTAMDLRASHFATVDHPLTYRHADGALGIPGITPTVELAASIRPWLLARGKWMMGNNALGWHPWAATLFDVAGIEGHLQPRSTASTRAYQETMLRYWRTLLHQKPFCHLVQPGAVTGGLSNLTTKALEQHLQILLMLALYPGFGEEFWTASDGGQMLYDKHRATFEKYMPIIKALSRAGWEPIPHVAAPSGVRVERYGSWPALFLAVRNESHAAAGAFKLTLDRVALGLPVVSGIAASAQIAGSASALSSTADGVVVNVSLPQGTSEVIRLVPAEQGTVERH